MNEKINTYMKDYPCESENLKPVDHFKMTSRWIELKEMQFLLDVAQHCLVLLFP